MAGRNPGWPTWWAHLTSSPCCRQRRSRGAAAPSPPHPAASATCIAWLSNSAARVRQTARAGGLAGRQAGGWAGRQCPGRQAGGRAGSCREVAPTSPAAHERPLAPPGPPGCPTGCEGCPPRRVWPGRKHAGPWCPNPAHAPPLEPQLPPRRGCPLPAGAGSCVTGREGK